MCFGFDTGYFVKYATGDLPGGPRQALRTVADGTAEGVASAIVIYELKKLGLRGVLDSQDADWLAETVGRACTIERHLTDEFLDEAARLSHGNGLSMADAMVLQAALRNEATRIYTSDSDLLAYNGPIDVISI